MIHDTQSIDKHQGIKTKEIWDETRLKCEDKLSVKQSVAVQDCLPTGNNNELKGDSVRDARS